MPPKVGRRPSGRFGFGAKAKAAPKARAPAAKVKAKAKANPRRRAAAKAGPGERRRRKLEDKLARGLSLEEWTGLKHIVVTVRLLLERQGESCRSREGTSRRGWADLHSDGPGGQSLLRYGSGNPGREVDLVVCPQDCDHELCAEGLIHVVRVEAYTEEKKEGWMTNLMAAAAPEEDQLEKLRQEAGAVDPRMERDRSKEPKKLKKLSRERKKEKKRKASPEKVRDRSTERPKKDSPEYGDRPTWRVSTRIQR